MIDSSYHAIKIDRPYTWTLNNLEQPPPYTHKMRAAQRVKEI